MSYKFDTLKEANDFFEDYLTAAGMPADTDPDEALQNAEEAASSQLWEANHECPETDLSPINAGNVLVHELREKSDAERQKICDALMGCHARDLEMLL